MITLFCPVSHYCGTTLMYSVTADTFPIVMPSGAAGVLTGLFPRRKLPFVALILAVAILIGEGICLAEIPGLERIGRGHSESWAGLVIPFLSVGSFVLLLPAALGAAGIRWLVSRGRAPPTCPAARWRR